MMRSQRGFTLMEAVLVIALTGIVAVMVGVFIRAPVTGYVDQARRAELVDIADTALRRLGRELQRALPNSIRVDATGTALEFLPVSAAGRYRAAPDAAGAGDFLDFGSNTDNSFAVLGPAVSVSAGDQLVVHNLGLPGADAYSGESRRALTSTGAALATLSYTVGGTQFPFASPGNRFQVVRTPVSFLCSEAAGGAGSLRRYAGYAIQAAQPTSAAAAPLSTLSGADNALLAAQVETCRFAYDPNVSPRNGLVTLTLKLTSGGESVTLMHQVHVDNAP
ncbi:MAG TPA: type II secretion system protein [Albitalea sp.]|uniref:PulJ/GspJ family protein n=1 Tax=Piscinibacter sp. TaxID=1903157 RepID=UPI002ED09BB6